MDKETILILVNITLTVAGGIVAFFMARLTAVIKELQLADKELDLKITKHREDVLKHYVTDADLMMLKNDLIARMDKLEETVVSLLSHNRP